MLAVYAGRDICPSHSLHPPAASVFIAMDPIPATTTATSTPSAALTTTFDTAIDQQYGHVRPMTSNASTAMDGVTDLSFDVLVPDEQLCLEGLLNDVPFDYYDPDSFNDLNLDHDSNSDSGCSTSCILSPGQQSLSSPNGRTSSECSPPTSPPSSDRFSPPANFYPHPNHTMHNNLMINPALFPAPAPVPLIAPAQRMPIADVPLVVRPIAPVKTAASIQKEEKLQQSLSLKEARKIRNREASLLSRKRQKETLSQLQTRNAALEKENQYLRNENMDLKKRICLLESQCDNRPESMKSSKRKTMGLLAVVFLIGMNVSPNGIFQAPAPADLVGQSPERTGRSLLWVPDYDDAELKDVSTAILMNNRSSFNSSFPSNCGKMLNATETQRVESELRGWAQRLEKQNLRSKLWPRKTIPRPFNKPMSLPHPVRTGFLLDPDHGSSGRAEEIFPLTLRQNMDSLLEAIHRREDTYYFVSLSPGDHMLLAAGAGNRTNVRPRFSLVMPALSTGNQKATTYTVMLIDCEVLNTEHVLVKNLRPQDSSLMSKYHRQPMPIIRSERKHRPNSNNRSLVSTKISHNSTIV